MPDPAERLKPVPGFRFAVEIDGVVAGYFTECHGLGMSRHVDEYREGGQNAYVHQLPGRLTQDKITLRRGLVDDVLWKWFAGNDGMFTFEPTVERHDITITLYNVDLSKAQTWQVKSAFPTKWTGPDLKTDQSEVAVEVLELAHHGISLSS